MNKEKLQELLLVSTQLERDTLDRMASGYSSGSVSAYRIAQDLNLDYHEVLDALSKFQQQGLVNWSPAQGWYISSSISEYFQLREQATFA